MPAFVCAYWMLFTFLDRVALLAAVLLLARPRPGVILVMAIIARDVDSVRGLVPRAAFNLARSSRRGCSCFSCWRRLESRGHGGIFGRDNAAIAAAGLS